MADSGFAEIQAINDLEEGIHRFGHQMADSNSEIEHTINLYFENFERGLQILEERLRRAEEELERAERALERQRNKRVLVRDRDGDGWHWEQADCSAEEARVACCKAVRDRCRRDVDTCRQMISDARSKRYIHKEKFSQFETRTSEAIDKIGPAKEMVEKHNSTAVPSSMASHSGGTSGTFPSTTSASASSISRGADLPRPRPPMNPNPSYRPKPNPITERPRGPQNERINPAPNRPITEADRPRSPFGNRGNVTSNPSSFWDDIRKISDEYKNNESNE